MYVYVYVYVSVSVCACVCTPVPLSMCHLPMCPCLCAPVYVPLSRPMCPCPCAPVYIVHCTALGIKHLKGANARETSTATCRVLHGAAPPGVSATGPLRPANAYDSDVRPKPVKQGLHRPLTRWVRPRLGSLTTLHGWATCVGLGRRLTLLPGLVTRPRSLARLATTTGGHGTDGGCGRDGCCIIHVCEHKIYLCEVKEEPSIPAACMLNFGVG